MVVVAGLANTAGSDSDLGHGSWPAQRLRGALPRPADKLARAEAVYTRWGRWSLLASWAPLGDLICLAAGVMRVPLWQFVAIVGVAKTARYAALAAATAGVLSSGWT